MKKLLIAGIFSTLGSKVSIIYRGESLLRGINGGSLYIIVASAVEIWHDVVWEESHRAL